MERMTKEMLLNELGQHLAELFTAYNSEHAYSTIRRFQIYVEQVLARRLDSCEILDWRPVTEEPKDLHPDQGYALRMPTIDRTTLATECSMSPSGWWDEVFECFVQEEWLEGALWTPCPQGPERKETS